MFYTEFERAGMARSMFLSFIATITFTFVAGAQTTTSTTTAPTNATQPVPTPTPAPGTKTESNGKNFEVISFNADQHTFTTDLPFDVPFVITGTTTTAYDEIRAYVKGFRKSKSFHDPSNGCKHLLTDPLKKNWELLGPDEEVADNTFALLSPELQPNKYYRYCIVYTDRSTPTQPERDQLVVELRDIMHTLMKESELVSEGIRINKENLEAFQRDLLGAVIAVYGADFSAPPNSVFNPATKPEVVKQKLLDNILPAFSQLRKSADAFDLTKNNTDAGRAKEILKKIFADYKDLIKNIATGGFTAQEKKNFEYLQQIDPSTTASGGDILANALTGASGLDLNVTSASQIDMDLFKEVQKNSPIDLATNFEKSETVLAEIATFLTALSTSDQDRQKLANYGSAVDAAAKATIDASNKTLIIKMLSDINTVKNQFASLKTNTTQLLSDGAAAKNAMDALVANLAAIIITEIVKEVNGSSYAEFKTRANLYVGADIGMSYMFGNYGLSPYIGTNVYLRPINKQAPLVGLMFTRRFSFLIGLNLPFFGNTASQNDPKNLFNNKPSLLTGGGFRLSHSLRINGGWAWMRTESDYFDTPGVKWTPFVAISFDVNVATVLNQLMPKTLRNELLNP